MREVLTFFVFFHHSASILIVPFSQFQPVPVCFLINFFHADKSPLNLSHLFLS
uniref:Uncharacterized protein n=1 Tax=Setaria viridis TaxID=4556 RepID=A0A4U6V5R6_SETVI|nr:hypothetical protein SEVIR_3G057266v2 [Setaria viridis]